MSSRDSVWDIEFAFVLKVVGAKYRQVPSSIAEHSDQVPSNTVVSGLVRGASRLGRRTDLRGVSFIIAIVNTFLIDIFSFPTRYCYTYCHCYGYYCYRCFTQAGRRPRWACSCCANGNIARRICDLLYSGVLFLCSFIVHTTWNCVHRHCLFVHTLCTSICNCVQWRPYFVQHSLCHCVQRRAGFLKTYFMQCCTVACLFLIAYFV